MPFIYAIMLNERFYDLRIALLLNIVTFDLDFS